MNEAKPIAVLEPWALGDAAIAASICRLIDRPVILLIHSKYISLIGQLLQNHPHITLKAVDLEYTKRANGKKFIADLKRLKSFQEDVSTVYSIRGDFRDHLVAKKLYPNAKVNMCGYDVFFARRLGFVDALLRLADIPVKNRYQQWLRLLPTSTKDLPQQNHRPIARNARIFIHTGAQWRSKTYPYAIQVYQKLLEQGFDAIIGYGPGDPEPQGVKHVYIDSQNLISELKAADMVMTNDSGPMHLAAFVGCRVLVIANASNIYEWLPPNTEAMTAPSMPTGYRPKPKYMSDEVLEDWPSPDQVLAKIQGILKLP